MKNQTHKESFEYFDDYFYEIEVKSTIDKLLQINNDSDIVVELIRDSKNLGKTACGLDKNKSVKFFNNYIGVLKQYVFLINDIPTVILECFKSNNNDYLYISSDSIKNGYLISLKPLN